MRDDRKELYNEWFGMIFWCDDKHLDDMKIMRNM